MKNSMVVGFKDEAGMVREFAKRFKAAISIVQAGKYRAGEMKLSGPAKSPRHVVVVANVWENPESLFRVLLLSHELRHAGAKKVDLVAPWIAYGRQDRATRPGEEPAGLMVGRLLSAMFDKIVTLDAHSQEFRDGFKGKLTNVIPWKDLESKDEFDLVAAPDEGATSRASYAAESLGVPFIVIEKVRHGKNVKSKLPAGTKAKGARILLVDDMADSGSTLKAAAVALKKAGARSIAATVAHAFDLCRLSRITKKDIREIDCFFDHATGTIAGDALKSLADAV